MSPKNLRRPYRKRKRAQSEEETRRRITEAAVELHGTVGPARTKVTELAERAGVSRMTIYNHFPTDLDLFAACSSHWEARNPYPDSSRWTEVSAPAPRLRTALEELYGWYERNRGMLENIFRDAPLMESLRNVVDGHWDSYYMAVVSALAEGWPTDPEDEVTHRAILRLVVDFHTWKVLANSGLTGPARVEVAAGMVLSRLPGR